MYKKLIAIVCLTTLSGCLGHRPVVDGKNANYERDVRACQRLAEGGDEGFLNSIANFRSEEEQESIVTKCMKGRGHNVIEYEKSERPKRVILEVRPARKSFFDNQF